MTKVELKAIKNKKNMYERWRDGELPEWLQSRLDSAYRETLDDQGIFKAGFLCSSQINKYRKEMGIEEYDKRVIIACTVKDYFIDLDGKKTKVSGQRYTGVFTGKDETYFEGSVFDEMPDGSYELGGTVSLSKQEFANNVKEWTVVF